jgi:hypothetical protein
LVTTTLNPLWAAVILLPVTPIGVANVPNGNLLTLEIL